MKENNKRYNNIKWRRAKAAFFDGKILCRKKEEEEENAAKKV